MGIDTSAVIVVGYTYKEVQEIYDKYLDGLTPDDYVSDFYDWKEDNDNDLRTISPYYDATYKNCLFGVTITTSGDYSYKTFNLNEAEIKGVTQTLTEQFGIEPKVYLTPYVS